MFQKTIYFCFIDYAKHFVCVDQNKLENSSREEYQTTWPASWEVCMQIKKQQLELDMAQQTDLIGKGVRQGCILSLGLFNLYVEYIMQNAGLDETQARIQIAMRNINNLRYTDDTSFKGESKEKLKSLLMKVKEKCEKLA